MNILENRIDSFHNNTIKWPYLNKQYHKIETFAKAGFYFMKRPKATDTVRCFLCNIELSHWKQGQSPYTRHAAEAPQCPWTILNFPDNNKPLIINEDDPSSRPRHAVMRNARLATFNNHSYWPPNKSGPNKSNRYPTATKLADAGFYFSATLDHRAKVKCPYCQLSIMEPDRNTNYLDQHKQLCDGCPFFQKIHNVRSVNKRDTMSSTTSTDTFKTASSQLDNDNTLKKRKLKDTNNDPPSIKQKKLSSISNEDSFWDIGKTFESVLPPRIRKPAITFGTKTTTSRLKSQRNDSINIFSNVKKSSLIVKPFEKESKSKQTNSKVVSSMNELQKVAIAIPEESTSISIADTDKALDIPSTSVAISSVKNLPLDDFETSLEPIKQDSPVQKSNIPDENIEPVKKDKGKGKAIDHNVPVMPNYKKSTISLSKSKNLTYLQSTPRRSQQNNMVEASDIFGDLLLSPIAHSNSTEAPTPTLSHQQRSIIPADGKARPQPPSPTHKAQDTVLNLNEIMDQLPPTNLTDQEKKMKVEEYLHHVIDKNIQKIKSHGDLVVLKIQEKADAIKQELLKQK